MTSTAAKSASFYSSFSATLSSIESSIASAQSLQDFDAVLAEIVEARSTLKEKDLEGVVSNRDREQYQRRLTKIQESLTQKRSSSSSSFSFRRPPKSSQPKADDQQNTNSSSGNNDNDNIISSITTSTAANMSATSESSGVQITLQSQRLLTFQDLPLAARSQGSEGLSLSLSHLSECIIDLREAPKPILALHATNLKGCLVLLAEVQGSVLLSGIEGTTIAIRRCRQFRIYGSKATTIFVNASSPVTLEACTSLIISSLHPGELDEICSTTTSTLVSDVQVQDFDAPGAGAVTTGTSSWNAPTASQRSDILTRMKDLLAIARENNNPPSSWLPSLSQLQSPQDQDLFRQEDAGILLVFSDPGETSTLEEFHDWYDNEHVPLRTLAFQEFRSAGRYEVVESSHSSSDARAFKAGWGAMYTISDNSLYSNPSYSALRTNRSPREADLVRRLGVLDRRIYTLKFDSLSDQPKGDIRPRTKEEIQKETYYILHIGFNLLESTNNNNNKQQPEMHVLQWFRDAFLPAFFSDKERFSTVTRIRLFTLCGDALIVGRDVSVENGDAREVGQWAIEIELSSSSSSSSENSRQEEKEHVLQAAWKKSQELTKTLAMKDVEQRKMRLYRAWDPVRALQLE